MGLIYRLRARTYGCWGMILLKFVLTGRAFVFIIDVILQKAPGGARQQGCKAFRSGAANDEFDGYARYSGTSWPKGKLGGNAGISTLVPLMGREFFYWYGRRLSLRSSRSKRWKYEESVQFQCRPIGNAFGSPQGSAGRISRFQSYGDEHRRNQSSQCCLSGNAGRHGSDAKEAPGCS